MIEAMMGRAMLHPESRITVRAGFEQPIPLERSLADIDPVLAQIVLRDAALVAAVDGDYDRKELTALRKMQKPQALPLRSFPCCWIGSRKGGFGSKKQLSFYHKNGPFSSFC